MGTTSMWLVIGLVATLLMSDPIIQHRRNPMMGDAPSRSGIRVFDPRGSAAGPGTLNGVPEFARQTVDWSKVKEINAGRLPRPLQWVGGEVDPDNPTTIKIHNPKEFTPDVRGHEATHVSQFARTDGVNPGQDIDVPEPSDPNKTYDYGGIPGLLKARDKGKTMADFSVEQQAAMVQDYIYASRQIEKEAKAGKVNKYDLADYADLQKAYHPFLQQLAPQPQGNEINTHPDAPGLPPADTPGLGVLKPDPLLGGESIATERPRKSPTPPKGKQVSDSNQSAPDERSAHDRLHEIASRALSSLPEQLQRHLTSDNVNFGHGDLEDTFNTGRPDYAGVVKGDPHTIMFDNHTPLDDHTVQQLVAHEGMHIIQHNLPPEVSAKIPADDLKDPYNYGGAQGLMNLRQQGGTILSLPREKQAAVVQYYVSQRPHVTGQAAADLDAVYKPYLDDLDKLPQSQVQPTAPQDNSGTIDTTPRAPTPPPDAYGTGQ